MLLLLGVVALLAASLTLFPPASKKQISTASQETQLTSDQVKDAAAIQKMCARRPDAFTCYKQAFEKIVSQGDTQQALAVLEQVAAQDRSVLSRAHDYAHAIGKFSFGHYKDAPKAFSQCSDLFASGCYHGVLEGYLSSTPQVALEDIATLCGTEVQTKQTEFVRFQCLHGLGHGLTMYFEHDIFKALEYCDFLKTAWERESCYGGVFMENIVFASQPKHGHEGHHKSFLKPEDPLYPCNSVERKYQGACYLLQSSAILMFTHSDFAKAFKACDKAPQEFIPICYQSMGRDISGFTLRNPKRSNELCLLGSKDYISDCIVGVVKDFINTSANEEPGVAFCRQINAAYKARCYSAIGQMVQQLYPDSKNRAVACAKAEGNYADVCATAAGLYRK